MEKESISFMKITHAVFNYNHKEDEWKLTSLEVNGEIEDNKILEILLREVRGR